MKIIDEKDLIMPSYDAIQARIAIRRTIDMWTDMQTELGENPSMFERATYKVRWCEEHGYTGWNRPDHECFLCEFACAGLFQSNDPRSRKCDFCPIKWPEHEFVPEMYTEDDYNLLYNEAYPYLTPGCQAHRVDYLKAPLSDILEYLRDESNWRYE